MAKKKKTSKKKLVDLDERLKEIKNFLDLWLQFHKSYKRAYRGEEVSLEAEGEFLKMKSLLARRHSRLMESLGKNYVGAEPIRPLLSQTVTLRHMTRIRPEHYEQIERKWHNTYIHLNETIGKLRFLIE